MNPKARAAVGIAVTLTAAIALVAGIYEGANRLGVFGSATGRCAVIVDDSASRPTAEFLEEAVNAALNICGQEQSDTALFLASSAGTRKLVPVGEEFVPNSEPRRKRAVSSLLELRSEAEGISRSSDLLVPILEVSTSLRDRAAIGDVARLVVVSDGVHLAEGSSVGLLTEDRASAVALVEVASNQGLLPDLAGVRIHFVGVRSGTYQGSELPAWWEERLQNFWTAFVETSGGTLCSYSSIAPSGSFETC